MIVKTLEKRERMNLLGMSRVTLESRKISWAVTVRDDNQAQLASLQRLLGQFMFVQLKVSRLRLELAAFSSLRTLTAAGPALLRGPWPSGPLG